ncbi:hypothetical protein V2O64_24480 (plasmid) [Verrucomicrobiaceae bacterium 227]
MKTNLVSAILTTGFALSAGATEQVPDTITFKDRLCEVETTWEYPTPIEAYYVKTGEKYPFAPLHTANYRGHIAHWEIRDKALVLAGIKRVEMTFDEETSERDVIIVTLQPKDYFPKFTKNGVVHASWFSGILVIRRSKIHEEIEGTTLFEGIEDHVFLYMEDGLITKEVVLSDAEHSKSVGAYFRRRKTDNPVTTGPVFDQANYILSFRRDRTQEASESESGKAKGESDSARQDGPEQAPTAPESKLKGKVKPKPE